MKEGGTIAFVMPKTVVPPSKQHVNFQRQGFSKIHDLSKVTVVGLVNQHFFNVKSCAVVNDGHPHKDRVPTAVWMGQFPSKNLTWEKAKLRLTAEEALHELLPKGDARSVYYYQRFLQGATLTPRPLWNVDVDAAGSLNLKVPRLRTTDSAYRATKEQRWKVRLRGPVEREFLFTTVMGEDLLPFIVRQLTLYVLPVALDNGRFHMVSHEEILAMGFDRASDWVKKAKHIWRSRATDRAMSAQQRLDYQRLLTVQRPGAPHIVLYNTSGTNISAAYLPFDEQNGGAGDLATVGFIADTVTYYFYPDSETEAHYLVGVLNSNVVNDAIKPYQPEGVYHGKRHIHRRPFEVCPIEQFDSKNPIHREIARLAKAAKAKLSSFQMEGSLAKAREMARDWVRDEIDAIDALVGQMFQPTPVRSEKKVQKAKLRCSKLPSSGKGKSSNRQQTPAIKRGTNTNLRERFSSKRSFTKPRAAPTARHIHAQPGNLVSLILDNPR